jgi:ABC-type transporter Mla subunit MlaD
MIFSNLDSWKSVLEQAKDNSKHISNLSVNTAKTFEQNSREINAAAKSAAQVDNTTNNSSNTNETTISNNTTTQQQHQSNKKI